MLRNGHMALIYNDTEQERDKLAISISTDNGTTWKVISDASFSEAGRNVDAQFVAADKSHIVVVGEDDVAAASSANAASQRESVS